MLLQDKPLNEPAAQTETPWWVKIPVERQTEILRSAILTARELFKGQDAYEMLRGGFELTDEELADIAPDLVQEHGRQDEAPSMRMGG